MKSAHLRFTVPAAVLVGLVVTPAMAQRMPPSPEQRIERLERQVQQVQRRVFPQGQPADTAGFSAEPAATQAAVSNLDNRIGALERQLANFLRQSEENAFRVRQLETEMERLREQEARVRLLEQRLESLAAAAPAAVPDAAPAGSDRPARVEPRTADSPSPAQAAGDAETDPGEEAYDVGYELWRDGRYDQAITALRAMASSFPGHRRVSWANNLAGRAMLDKGEPRAAAEALLANYRANPKGERAADSLFYLGQALMELDQPGQACKAYAELEAVYGSSMRPALRDLLPDAKRNANCG